MLNNIIGQAKLKEYIGTEITRNTLSYGYIIEGKQYMGKNFIAHEVASEITVDSYIQDVIPSEGRKLLQVDDIRDLKENAYSSSYKGAKKVYILDHTDKMTVSAQNAFLKLLEEPPQDCIFILLTEDRYKLLETIRSRCTVLTLTRYSDKDIEEFVKAKEFVPDMESIKLCDGCITKWEHINNPQYEKDIKELAFRIVLNIKDLHPARIFAITKHLKKVKDEINDILDIFLIFYRDLYMYKTLKDSTELEFASRLNDIIRISNMYTEEKLLEIIDMIQHTRVAYQVNANFDMTSEMLLLAMREVI